MSDAAAASARPSADLFDVLADAELVHLFTEQLEPFAAREVGKI